LLIDVSRCTARAVHWLRLALVRRPKTGTVAVTDRRAAAAMGFDIAADRTVRYLAALAAISFCVR
jgi:hypothetical protein